MGKLEDNLVILTGFVKRTVYHAPKMAFAIQSFDCENGSKGVRLLVRDAIPDAGACVSVQGVWQEHPNHGRQFRVLMWTPAQPRSRPGMVKYLSRAANISESLAKRAVEYFGDSIFEIIEEEPHRLLEVPGIGALRLDKIASAMIDAKGERETIIFLTEAGLNQSLVHKVIEKYGCQCLDHLRENPYVLLGDIPGIGFKTADRVALRLGLSHGSPFRIAAGVRFKLGELAAQAGHCAFPTRALLIELKALLGVDESPITDVCRLLLREGSLVCHADGPQRLCALSYFYESEAFIALRIKALAQAVRIEPRDPERLVRSVEPSLGIDLAYSQRKAVIAAMSSRIAVLTGGPGVGKTTIVRAITAALRLADLPVLLAAPTGRAASRLAEVTGEPAVTIHKLLEYNPEEGFQRNARRPLEDAQIVIDEVSMVDTKLMAALLAACPEGASLLLVGDADQLASVGPGHVLHDVMESGVVPVIRLSQVFRQAGESGIVVNAHRIIRGQAPIFTDAGSGHTPDFMFVDASSMDKAALAIVDLVSQTLPRSLGLHPVHDIQVLAPIYRSLVGVDALNDLLQKALNPAPPAANGSRVYPFALGDKVMQTVNDNDRGVFNGEIGYVREIDRDAKEIFVAFGNRLIVYSRENWAGLRLAYAATVHKAQGSEFPAVVIPVVPQHSYFFQRRLLYTAVTRAKSLVVLVGDRKSLAAAVANNRVSARFTCLPGLLRDGISFSSANGPWPSPNPRALGIGIGDALAQVRDAYPAESAL